MKLFKINDPLLLLIDEYEYFCYFYKIAKLPAFILKL